MMSIKNATFNFENTRSRNEDNLQNESITDFRLESVCIDIKKVSIILRVHTSD